MPAGLQCWDASGRLRVDSGTRTLRFDWEAEISLTFAGTGNCVGLIYDGRFRLGRTVVVGSVFITGEGWQELHFSVAGGVAYAVRRPAAPGNPAPVRYRVFQT